MPMPDLCLQGGGTREASFNQQNLQSTLIASRIATLRDLRVASYSIKLGDFFRLLFLRHDTD